MGRTQPTFRNLLDRLVSEWSDYRRGLTAREREVFDALWQKARAHASASSNANRLHPMEAVFMSILLEQERELRRFRRTLRDMPDASDERGDPPRNG